jgi:RimJ/RimL family protein N-acetyltransferase
MFRSKSRLALAALLVIAAACGGSGGSGQYSVCHEFRDIYAIDPHGPGGSGCDVCFRIACAQRLLHADGGRSGRHYGEQLQRLDRKNVPDGRNVPVHLPHPSADARDGGSPVVFGMGTVGIVGGLGPEAARLILRPHTPRQILALMEDPDSFKGVADFPAAPGLREFFVSGEISPQWIATLRTRTQADPWTLGFAVIDRESRTIVGSAGFKGRADVDGVVEVAYGIVPSFQRRGYATEATHALMAFAREDSEVRRVRAHTLPTANPSTCVLTKCGFAFVGEVIDPEDGLVWRWERTI